MEITLPSQIRNAHDRAIVTDATLYAAVLDALRVVHAKTHRTIFDISDAGDREQLADEIATLTLERHGPRDPMNAGSFEHGIEPVKS